MAKKGLSTKQIVYIGLGVGGGVAATVLLVRMFSGGNAYRPLPSGTTQVQSSPSPKPAATSSTLTKRQIEDVQSYLVYTKKHNLGNYGPNKDGVDGDAGTLTNNALKKEGYTDIVKFYNEVVSGKSYQASSPLFTSSNTRSQNIGYLRGQGKIVTTYQEWFYTDAFFQKWADTVREDKRSDFSFDGVVYNIGDGNETDIVGDGKGRF